MVRLVYAHSLAAILLFAPPHSSPAQAIERLPRTQLLTRALIIRSAPGYLETIAARDPIEARVVAGTWSPPRAGEEVQYNDTLTCRWETVGADSNGWFDHAALAGGYVYMCVEAGREETVVLEGSGHTMVYVNGAPRAGNPYGTKDSWEAWEPRFDFSQVPVELRRGRNDLLFHCARGALKVRLSAPRARVFINTRDATLPDLVVGSRFDELGSVAVVNASGQKLTHLTLRAVHAGGRDGMAIPPVQPLSIRKVAFRLSGQAPDTAGPYTVRLAVMRASGTGLVEVDTATLTLRVVGPADTRKETFTSGIDGSVQYYALNPARGSGRQIGGGGGALFFSLHGAAVEALNQAASYSAKSWGHIVAPTNRRPYGYNWEDWGRIDALEVLEFVTKKLAVDDTRIYLTGHSMGGHGTYHIASLYPDRFAAIGPSAGWVSFWSYRIRQSFPGPSPVREMIQRATITSDTYAMARNYRQLGVYVLHGSDDDNVPVRESRAMADTLARFHRDMVYHEEPGAGHWWDVSEEPGTDCVDYAPMFDFFGRHVRPAAHQVRHVEFITGNPGVSSRNSWVEIEAQTEQLRPSSVNIDLEQHLRRYTGTTRNVRRLSLDVSGLEPGVLTFVLDGQRIDSVAWPPGRVWLERSGTEWRVVPRPSPALKGPHRYGPFKDAFRNRMVFVFGTRGTAQENRWAFEKARFDAERFWYQGNGSVDVVADTEFDPAKDTDRNVILFGNARTNRAWNALVGAGPVEVDKGEARVGEKHWRGDDLACLFIRPRPSSDVASVGVVAGTGIEGMRYASRMSYLMPGIGFPDCLVISAESLVEGEPGVRLAGYFGTDWSVESGEWR